MTISRNWLQTLWAASYKGVPFFVEKDNESGSRRIVEHEFPMRDFPYLEDLGEGVRHFQVTAYVASDSADGQASAVMQICATRGPGMLVLPTHGPILVRCLEFERDRTKDKHGYIAHSLKFSREGASGALASVAMLANLVFAGADQMAIAVALSFKDTAAFLSQPSYVRDAAVNGVENNVSALEAVRTVASIDPVVSAAQRVEIQSIFDASNDIVAPEPAVGSGEYLTDIGLINNSPAVDLASRAFASTRALGDGMNAAQAISTFEELFQSAQIVVPAPIYATPGTLAAVETEEAANRALRLAALTVYCEAIARAALADRPTALTLRANVAEYFEQELQGLSAADNDLAHAITAMRDVTIDYLSRAILDLAPIITVDANLVMPSLFWSWRLYSDPGRAMEIAERNHLSHPSFVPQQFEAKAR